MLHLLCNDETPNLPARDVSMVVMWLFSCMDRMGHVHPENTRTRENEKAHGTPGYASTWFIVSVVS